MYGLYSDHCTNFGHRALPENRLYHLAIEIAPSSTAYSLLALEPKLEPGLKPGLELGPQSGLCSLF